MKTFIRTFDNQVVHLPKKVAKTNEKQEFKSCPVALFTEEGAQYAKFYERAVLLT